MPFNFSFPEYLSHHRTQKNRVSPVSRASPAHMNSPSDENYNNQSVGGQNNVNQSVGDLDSNDPNESVYSKHDGKSKFRKKVTVIAGDPL